MAQQLASRRVGKHAAPVLIQPANAIAHRIEQ
jgi:hypothetical protein